jgi:predicted transcriptional regulator
MKKQDEAGLTKLELQIMQVIWKLGSGNVTAVQQGLQQELAYTTVQTMLNILHRKGKLRRSLEGRAFVYSAALTQTRASGHALRELVDRMFAGSSEDLVMSLVKSGQLDPKKLAALGRKLERHAQKERDDA